MQSRNQGVTKTATPQSHSRWQSSGGKSVSQPDDVVLGNQLGETLLSQYKKCNQHNREQLMQVKNIQDLVKINVATIDKEMFINTRKSHPNGREQTNYDFKWDPINFRQKVPCMGDRNFLVNQAILQNFGQPTRSGTRGFQRRGRNTHKSVTSSGAMSHLPQLKSPEAEVMSYGGKTRASLQFTQEEMQSAVGIKEQEVNSEIDSTYPVSNRGSQLEPVKNLQLLFKKKQYKKRNPGTNLIIEKYKQRTNSIAFNASRQQYNQDHNYNYSKVPETVSGTYEIMSQVSEPLPPQTAATSVRFSQTMTTKLFMPDNQQAFQSKPHTTANQRIYQGPLDLAYQSEDQQMQRKKPFDDDIQKTKLTIREKLENLKQLFEEQDKLDSNERMSRVDKNQASDQDLTSHKIMYQEAMDRRKEQLQRQHQKEKSQGLKGMSPVIQPSKNKTQVNQVDMLDAQEDQLRDFLMDRIAELKMATYGKADDLQELNKPAYKYKASTISNILPSHDPLMQLTHRKLDVAYKNKIVLQMPKSSEATYPSTLPVSRVRSSRVKQIAVSSSNLLVDRSQNETTLLTPNAQNLPSEKIVIDDGSMNELEEPVDFQQPEEAQNEEDSQLYFKKIELAAPGSKSSAKERNYYSQCMREIARIDKQFDKQAKQRKLNQVLQNQRDIMVELNYLQQDGDSGEPSPLRTSQHSSQQSSPSAQILMSNQFESVKPEKLIQSDENVVTEHLAQKKPLYRDQMPSHKVNILDQFEIRKIKVEAHRAPVSAQIKEKRTVSGFIRATKNLKNDRDQSSTMEQVERLISFSPRKKNFDINVSNQASTRKLFSENHIQTHLSQGTNQIKDDQTIQRGRTPESNDYDSLVKKQNIFAESTNKSGPKSLIATKFQIVTEMHQSTLQPKVTEKNQIQIYPPEIKITPAEEKAKIAFKNTIDVETMEIINALTQNNLDQNQKEKYINLATQFQSTPGAQMSYFCPKRFKRFPRFTIFFKKGEKTEQSQYVVENTVSLNVDFLKFLVENQQVSSESVDKGQATSFNDSIERTSPRLSAPSDIRSMLNTDEIEKKLANIPSDLADWNNYLKQQNFDPFDKVVLVKGIDNSILTSYRTLKGENNTVSDTFKIVHKKFLPQKNTNHKFYKQMMQNQFDKMPYTVEEEAQNENEIAFDYIEEDIEAAEQLIFKPLGVVDTQQNSSLKLWFSPINTTNMGSGQTPQLTHEIKSPVSMEETLTLMKEESKQKKPDSQYVQIQKIKKQQHQDRKRISPFTKNQVQASIQDVTPLKGSKLNTPLEVREEIIEFAGKQERVKIYNVSGTQDIRIEQKNSEIGESESGMKGINQMLQKKGQIDVYLLKKVQKEAPWKKGKPSSPRMEQPFMKASNTTAAEKHSNAFIPVTTQRNPYKQKPKSNQPAKTSPRTDISQVQKEQVLVNCKEEATSPNFPMTPKQIVEDKGLIDVSGMGEIDLLYSGLTLVRGKEDSIPNDLEDWGQLPNINVIKSVVKTQQFFPGDLARQQSVDSSNNVNESLVTSPNSNMLFDLQPRAQPISNVKLVFNEQKSKPDEKQISPNISSHVGLLKIPSSLANNDNMENFVEKLAYGIDQRQQISNKHLINKIFEKERKYTKMHDKESYLVPNNAIFSLDKTAHLKSITGVERSAPEKYQLKEDFEILLQNNKNFAEMLKPVIQKAVKLPKSNPKKIMIEPQNLKGSQLKKQSLASQERENPDYIYDDKIERIFQQIEMKTSGMNDDFDVINAVEIDEIKRDETEFNNKEINQ